MCSNSIPLFDIKDSIKILRGNVNNSIFGRSVVIHDMIDESLKTGNALGRILCVIISKSK